MTFTLELSRAIMARIFAKKIFFGEIDFEDIIRILKITRISVTLFMTSSTALWI